LEGLKAGKLTDEAISTMSQLAKDMATRFIDA